MGGCLVGHIGGGHGYCCACSGGRGRGGGGKCNALNRRSVSTSHTSQGSEPYTDPCHDKWLPLANVRKLEVFREFLKTDKYKALPDTPDFAALAHRWPHTVP